MLLASLRHASLTSTRLWLHLHNASHRGSDAASSPRPGLKDHLFFHPRHLSAKANNVARGEQLLQHPHSQNKWHLRLLKGFYLGKAARSSVSPEVSAVTLCRWALKTDLELKLPESYEAQEQSGQSCNPMRLRAIKTKLSSETTLSLLLASWFRKRSQTKSHEMPSGGQLHLTATSIASTRKIFKALFLKDTIIKSISYN